MPNREGLIINDTLRFFLIVLFLILTVHLLNVVLGEI